MLSTQLLMAEMFHSSLFTFYAAAAGDLFLNVFVHLKHSYVYILTHHWCAFIGASHQKELCAFLGSNKI